MICRGIFCLAIVVSAGPALDWQFRLEAEVDDTFEMAEQTEA